MKAETIYKLCYAYLENVTPLRTDCGKLCGGACCKESDVGSGMYLYPYEINAFSEDSDWFTLTQTTEKYDGVHPLILMECSGVCDRRKRPLACRIFPLAPYYDKDGAFSVVIDPRARGLCPLADNLSPEDFTPAFTENVRKVFNILRKFSDCRAFMEYQSRQMDEWESIREMFEV